MTRFATVTAVLMLALIFAAPCEVRAQALQSGANLGVATETIQRQSRRPPAGEPQPELPVLSDATKQGIGCVAAGATGLGLALWAGAADSIMIVAGGMLVPSATSTVLLALTATTVGATCALGASATPFVLWAAEQKDNIVANVAWHVRRAGAGLAGLFTQPAAAEPQQLAQRAR